MSYNIFMYFSIFINAVPNVLLKKRRYELMTKLLGFGLSFSNQLINKKYFGGFSDFLDYIYKKISNMYQ